MSKEGRSDWTLVETMIDGETTIVGKGGAPRNWTEGLQRISPDPYLSVPSLLARIRLQSNSIDEIHDLEGRRRRSLRVVAHPVRGPGGHIHAWQVWIGEAAVEPPEPRIVAGVTWYLEKAVIAQTVEASMMSGVPPENHVPGRTPAEYYAKSVRFDDTEGLFSLAFAPVHGKTWSGSFSVLHADGRIMRWHCHAKAFVDGSSSGVRVVWHDTTDTTAPEAPTLDVVARRKGLQAFGVYSALLAPAHAFLPMWLSDTPAPWVAWRDVGSGRDVLHPDDRDRLRSAHLVVQRDDEFVELNLRFRGARNGWVDTAVRISPYPGGLGEHLVVADIYLRPVSSDE